MEAKLIVVGGKANKSEIKLKLPTTIGRSRHADLTVAHPKVSRQHCQLFERDGVLVVRDSGSLNGTFIGEERITEAVLKPGDKLTVGPLTFLAEYQHTGAFPDLPATTDMPMPQIETVDIRDPATVPNAAAGQRADDVPDFQFSPPAAADDEPDFLGLPEPSPPLAAAIPPAPPVPPPPVVPSAPVAPPALPTETTSAAQGETIDMSWLNEDEEPAPPEIAEAAPGSEVVPSTIDLPPSTVAFQPQVEAKAEDFSWLDQAEPPLPEASEVESVENPPGAAPPTINEPAPTVALEPTPPAASLEKPKAEDFDWLDDVDDSVVDESVAEAPLPEEPVREEPVVEERVAEARSPEPLAADDLPPVVAETSGHSPAAEALPVEPAEEVPAVEEVAASGEPDFSAWGATESAAPEAAAPAEAEAAPDFTLSPAEEEGEPPIPPIAITPAISAKRSQPADEGPAVSEPAVEPAAAAKAGKKAEKAKKGWWPFGGKKQPAKKPAAPPAAASANGAATSQPAEDAGVEPEVALPQETPDFAVAEPEPVAEVPPVVFMPPADEPAAETEASGEEAGSEDEDLQKFFKSLG